MASMMSDAPLSKEEQEEEEMRQELKDVGLYYENMSVDEMRQIVNVLNESKNDSRIPNEDAVDDSALFGKTRSARETSKASDNITKTPIPSFSYKQAVTSGTINQDSPLNDTKNSNDTNSQPSPSKSYEKNYTANSPDSESMYDRNSNFKKDEDYPSLMLSSRYKTRSTTADTRTRTQESKKTPAAKKASLERWALDPLEFVKDKNTTPLPRPQHSENDSEENLPYCSQTIDLDSEEFDKLCQQMVEKLSSFNKQCLQELEASQKMTAPIKIIHEEAPDNKPSVKKSPVKEKSSSINTPGPSNTSTRNTSERASKRKALSTIAAATEIFENDENSNDESSNTKKRKFQQAKKEEEAAKKNQENKKNKNGKSIETISIDDSKDSQDSFEDPDFHNMRKSSNKKVSNENKSGEAQSQYPRRVPPPNPGKKNYKGPRAKNKNNNNSTLIENKSDANEKKKMFLNDDEIEKTLQEINEQIEEGDCVEITNDIKPPPVSKRIGKRLSLATGHLENARELKEQKLKDEEEAKERREKEERLKKDALISSRLQEEENERSRQLDKKRKCDEQSALYKNILGNKSRVTRSNFQVKKTAEEIAEDLLLDGDDDEPTITRVIEKQLCPICQKPFPADEIETHASGCDAYAMDSNEAYNRPSTSRYTEIHKCQICDRYETQDGNAYEEHVINCKNKPRNLMNGGWIS